MGSRKSIAKALELIAADLRGSVTAGSDLSGTLAYSDDIDVEVTFRVKRRVSYAKTQRYRSRALATLAAQRYFDRCPHYVKNREWSPGSKSHACRGRVSVAIVRRVPVWEEGPLQPGVNRPLIDGELFEFACAHHADVNQPDVIAVVNLDKRALEAMRSKRRREDNERDARARIAERELAAVVKTLSDDELAKRLAAARAADEWRLEDACRSEQLARARSA